MVPDTHLTHTLMWRLKKNVRSAQMNTFHPAMKYIQSADKWRLNIDKKNVYKRMKYHKTRRCVGGKEEYALDIIGTFRVRV